LPRQGLVWKEKAMSKFTFRYKGKKLTVNVGPHVVAMYREDGSQVTNANVDYYYGDRGYGCSTEKAVAQQFYRNFRHLA
jgi:hypothetical protein